MKVPRLGRGRIQATAAGLHHSHSNAGSLTHWARPGIKSVSSWILVGFVSTEPEGALLDHNWLEGSGAVPRLIYCLLSNRSLFTCSLRSLFPGLCPQPTSSSSLGRPSPCVSRCRSGIINTVTGDTQSPRQPQLCVSGFIKTHPKRCPKALLCHKSHCM